MVNLGWLLEVCLVHVMTNIRRIIGVSISQFSMAVFTELEPRDLIDRNANSLSQIGTFCDT